MKRIYNLAQTNGLDFGLLSLHQLVKSQRVNNMEMGFNDIAKQCLLAHGYDYNAPVEERFLDFDFTLASYCASQGRVELYIQDNKNTKEFLEKNHILDILVVP